ncbi:MAG: tRNA (adenosine(37)-N6)-threonylcarbamoyltransferase complex ATPase subunit type 1 TsaE [Flavobacteriaceae bacterium]|nr:tRNA (adenosine(37)-N6)-threonylcarbamoyltransferase complex ATPase subunit type 1 TsaE [Flavobacteriaceae bacterium]
MELIYGITDLIKASQFIVEKSKSNLLLISGIVGSGKTTLIKNYCKLIGVNENVSSPTYALIHEYESEKGLVIHMDLYRLKNIDELNNLGVAEYFNNRKVIIEWPEIIIDKISSSFTHISLSYLDYNKRKISISNHNI